MKHLALAFISSLLFASPQLQAQQDELPLYEVELVIFKNNQVPRGREFILPVISPGRGDKLIELSSPASVEAARPLGYQFLPSDNLRLNEIVAKLVLSSRYELLLHTAWRQPGVELEQALPIWIKGGRVYGNEYTSIDNRIDLQGMAPASFDESVNATALQVESSELLSPAPAALGGELYELEGKITIALSRYLHSYVDLVLRRPQLEIDELPNSNAQGLSYTQNSADTRILNNHRLKEHRRMRSKTLHFLDNPEFGLLVLITPYKVPKNVEEAIIEAIQEDAAADNSGSITQ